jgi:hypothetical protein
MFSISGSINNSFSGVYTITVHAYDYAATELEHNTDSFVFTLLANQGPTVNNSVADQTLVAGWDLNQTIPAGLFDDPEGQSLTYGFYVTPPAPFITVDTASLSYYNLSTASKNSDVGVHVVTLTANDSNADTAHQTYSFQITINS